METKEQEILGQWFTRDRMKKSGEYTPCLDDALKDSALAKGDDQVHRGVLRAIPHCPGQELLL